MAPCCCCCCDGTMCMTLSLMNSRASGWAGEGSGWRRGGGAGTLARATYTASASGCTRSPAVMPISMRCSSTLPVSSTSKLSSRVSSLSPSAWQSTWSAFSASSLVSSSSHAVSWSSARRSSSSEHSCTQRGSPLVTQLTISPCISDATTHTRSRSSSAPRASGTASAAAPPSPHGSSRRAACAAASPGQPGERAASSSWTDTGPSLPRSSEPTRAQIRGTSAAA
mmetsp:Transcript_20887/g.62482  ORF Transcript_20887/g.62482 Transcript_20887/m.62482 type:complete len:225 (+) Transcript_20887:1125-1799(+)